MTMETHAGGPPGPGEPAPGPSGPAQPPQGTGRQPYGPPGSHVPQGPHDRGFQGPGGPQGAVPGGPRGPQGAGPEGPASPRDPGAGPSDGMPQEPRASRATTVTLIVALVLVVLITGVLGTIAVLMTRNPDTPLGAPPPRRLATPIHFVPVTSAQPGPCTSPEGYPDDTGQFCYIVAAGVEITAVRKIESIRESNGTYSVRIAFAPAFRDQINSVTEEAARQQLAIVVGGKVVAAPRVGEVITEDTLRISGSLTREQADAMVVRLGGPVATSGATPGASPGTPTPSAGLQQPLQPSTGTAAPSGGPAPATTAPAAAPTATARAEVTAPAGGPTATPSATVTASPKDAATGRQTGGGDNDPRYPSCKEAAKDGYGPYYKETHAEYHWYVDKDRDDVACDLDDMR
ncbi:hypothetical protein Psi01_51450 [Planobispora siamensis]|uniref:Excalibur calcium-binding domain-containing protein n=2 Tax=Planobispora siamensis TaxID=936338 RepID=A0A8J3SK16_9ACTN|nr:hypothetical protein Psi01_51450 [Planobispora siamensis]